MKLQIYIFSFILSLLLISCNTSPYIELGSVKKIPFPQRGGGAYFSEARNTPYALVGLRVRHGSYVDAVTPIYGQLKSDGTIGKPIEGHRYGGTGGRETVLTKQGYVIVGFSLRAGEYIDQLRISWQKWTATGIDSHNESQSINVGGPEGKPSDVRVPKGQVAVGIHGRSGTYVDRLSLIYAKPEF